MSYDTGSGSERKTQNHARVDSGSPDPVPPLVCVQRRIELTAPVADTPDSPQQKHALLM